jgi:hypothetical protein
MLWNRPEVAGSARDQVQGPHCDRLDAGLLVSHAGLLDNMLCQQPLCLMTTFRPGPTFFWSYDTFMTVSRFVLGSSIRVLVFRRISLLWLN